MLKRLAVMLFGAALLSGCATLGTGSEQAVIRAKDRVSPALVHIRPVKEVFRGGRREEMVVMGSGFIITPDGYVVTNEHVAGDSDLVRCVMSNKEEVEAEVVGTDRFTDIAVLKLQTPGLGEPHSFTIASGPDEDEVRFFIRDLGDWTAKIQLADLVGSDATIEGPYGHFKPLGKQSSRTVWISLRVARASKFSLRDLSVSPLCSRSFRAASRTPSRSRIRPR